MGNGYKERDLVVSPVRERDSFEPSRLRLVHVHSKSDTAWLDCFQYVFCL